MRFWRTPLGVAVVALIVGILAAVRLLAVFDWDPTVFAAFGEKATATTEYAEEKLGREVLTRPRQGHDGKFFFVQANDPWVLAADENAEILDRPVYRAQRMLYPLLAGAGGFASADVIIWTLPILNILMLGVGSWAVASIARHHGAPAWVGLAFALNIGLLSELFIDGAGITAFALTALGALALEKERFGSAAVAFAGAVLTREVMAIFVAFVGLFWLVRRRSIPWIVALPPVVAVVAWGGYLRMRIDVPSDAEQIREITFVPFSGVARALTSGEGNALDIAIIGVFLALVVVVLVRVRRSNVFLTWGSAGFAVLAPFLTIFVWQKSFDISRALAPLVTVFVLEMFIARTRRTKRDRGIAHTALGAGQA